MLKPTKQIGDFDTADDEATVAGIINAEEVSWKSRAEVQRKPLQEIGHSKNHLLAHMMHPFQSEHLWRRLGGRFW